MADEISQNPDVKPARASRRMAPSAISLICGLVAFSTTVDLDQIKSIQRYCTTCWSNARLDPSLWDDCTQEVCVRLLGKMKEGLFNWKKVLEDSESPERQELTRAIDAVKKQAQRLKRYLPLESSGEVVASRGSEKDPAETYALTELLRTAREKVLTPRQDLIIELWSQGAAISEIAREIGMKVAQVSDEKYKAMVKLENFLSRYRKIFGFSQASVSLA
ncbi:MAG: sigma-70 family RNA polymerase sigma factor [bacterium]